MFANGIEVDKGKVNFISKLPSPLTVKKVRSFLGHVGYYRRFIKDLVPYISKKAFEKTISLLILAPIM